MESWKSYTSKLSEDSAKKALEELHEKSEENRDQLKQFSTWIEQHKHWLTAPNDPVFLMAFLRVRKFSQLLARETLVNFFTGRVKEPKFFKNVNCDEEKTMKILKSSFFIPLPKRDKHGRQICIIRPAQMDSSGKSYKIDDAFKTVFMILDYLLLDEDVQVNGFVFLLDYTGVTMKHQSFAGEARHRFVKLLTKTYPVRMKMMLMYNVGTFLELVLVIVKTAMREKIQKRVETDSTMVGIYEKLGQSSLPLEYLPDDYTGEHAGTCAEIIDKLISNLQKPDMKAWTTDLSSEKYRVVESKMPPREELFQEAFRKLTVD